MHVVEHFVATDAKVGVTVINGLSVYQHRPTRFFVDLRVCLPASFRSTAASHRTLSTRSGGHVARLDPIHLCLCTVCSTTRRTTNHMKFTVCQLRYAITDLRLPFNLKRGLSLPCSNKFFIIPRWFSSWPKTTDFYSDLNRPRNDSDDYWLLFARECLMPLTHTLQSVWTHSLYDCTMLVII